MILLLYQVDQLPADTFSALGAPRGTHSNCRLYALPLECRFKDGWSPASSATVCMDKWQLVAEVTASRRSRVFIGEWKSGGMWFGEEDDTTASPTTSPAPAHTHTSPALAPSPAPIYTKDYFTAKEGTCASAGGEAIYDKDECTAAAKTLGDTFALGPFCCYVEVPNGCSIRRQNGGEMYLQTKDAKGVNATCNIGNECFCRSRSVGLIRKNKDKTAANDTVPPPRFVKGVRGRDACPSGHKKITDQATCAAGAAAVGWPYYAKTSDLTSETPVCNYCGGCGPHDGGTSVRIDSTHETSATWICERGSDQVWITTTTAVTVSSVTVAVSGIVLGVASAAASAPAAVSSVSAVAAVGGGVTPPGGMGSVLPLLIGQLHFVTMQVRHRILSYLQIPIGNWEILI